MKILQVHNYYRQAGGEDSVVSAEYELLRNYGHTVVQYTSHNDSVPRIPPFHLLQKTIFNRDTVSQVRELIARESPDVIHAHNTFPLISPSLYYAAAQAFTPVIQTLHNYRLLCPAATLLREGKICEDCVGKIPYPAVLHSCYRRNRAASAATAAMLASHRLLGTWRNKVQTFIALTSFAKGKFIEGGLDPEKLTVKPNFLVSDPAVGSGAGGYVLFASRLSEEKGLRVLMDAWDRLSFPIPLKIVGDGDLKDWLQQHAGNPNVEILGRRERAATIELIKSAALVVVPSLCYENLPMTIVEAFACGTPVITSTLPSMDELVADGVNGFRFQHGSAVDLAQRLEQVWRTPDLLRNLRQAARVTYEQTYTANQNYQRIMTIYQDALLSFQEAKRSAYECRCN